MRIELIARILYLRIDDIDLMPAQEGTSMRKRMKSSVGMKNRRKKKHKKQKNKDEKQHQKKVDGINTHFLIVGREQQVFPIGWDLMIETASQSLKSSWEKLINGSNENFFFFFIFYGAHNFCLFFPREKKIRCFIFFPLITISLAIRDVIVQCLIVAWTINERGSLEKTRQTFWTSNWVEKEKKMSKIIICWKSFQSLCIFLAPPHWPPQWDPMESQTIKKLIFFGRKSN